MSKKLWRDFSTKWYERLNLMHKFKKFCQWCTGKFEFWCLVGMCTLVEPILCSKWPTGYVLFAQVIVLAVSTFLYVIQLIGVASREWERIIMIEAMSSLQSLAIPKHMMDLSLLKIFIFFAAEGEYILEFFCLTIGWILIFWHPGLAALRCFRPFRLLWFYEVEIFRSSVELYFNPILGEVFVGRGFRVLKFAIKSLSALGNEMFRLTADTKGGLLLMMIFFYSAFVLGTSLWIETNSSLDNCNTAGTCMYTLMRLTFFDGTGFDFAYSLTRSHKILFFVTLMYMCITSFGILNGLVGIFGTAFERASSLAFEDEEERAAVQAATTAAVKAASRRDLYADDDEDGKKPNDNGSDAPSNPKSVRLTYKFIAALKSGKGKSPYAPVAPMESPAPSEGDAPNANGSKTSMEDIVKKNSAGASASGMFNAARRSRNNPNPPFGSAMNMSQLPSVAEQPQAAGQMQPSPPGNQVANLVAAVNKLDKQLEFQNKVMTNMFEHVLFLQKQIKYAESAQGLQLESFVSGKGEGFTRQSVSSNVDEEVHAYSSAKDNVI